MELGQERANNEPIDALQDPAVSPSRGRSPSVYSLRNWTSTEDDRCRSVSHMGLLMPLYLSPLLYYRTVFASCLYCMLLVLIMWALNAAPKPAIAILHMVNLPLMNLMSAEELATQYLTVDALLMVIVLYLVVLVDSLTDVVKRIAYTGCSHYGLRRNGIFLSLCAATFVAATLISTTVLCVPLLYVVDRVFSVIYKECMDQKVADSPFSRQSSGMTSNVATPAKKEVDSLFEKLAVYSHNLPKRPSVDQVSIASEQKQVKRPEQQDQRSQQKPETSPEGAHQGEQSSAGQPVADAAEATGADGAARTDTVANANGPLAARQDTESSAQPSFSGSLRPQGEIEAATAATTGKHQPGAEDNATRAPSNPANDNERNGAENYKRDAADGEKQRPTDDDKRAVAGDDDDGANEDTKTTKRGGKKGIQRRRSRQGAKDGPKGGGKEPVTRSAIKRKSKRVASQQDVGSPDKAGAPAQADECLSAAANEEMLFSDETQLSPGAVASPDTELSVLVGPEGRPQEDPGAQESRRRGRRGSAKRDRKSRKKERKLDVEKRATEAAEAAQAEEAADATKSPGARSPPVGEARSADADCASKPDTGAQATSKTSPHEPAGASSPSCVKGAPSDIQPESTSDPPAVTSPTGPAPKEQHTKAPSEKVTSAAEKRTLVIHESPSHLAAAKERKATEQAARAQKEASPDESLTPAEAPAPAMMQRRASILRQPGALPRFAAAGRGTMGRGTLARRASVVDFGADEYAAYVPGDVVAKPHILQDMTLSTQSASAASPERRVLPRKSISLRKASSRDESRAPRLASTLAVMNEESLKRKRQMKRRVDIHNAFLMGPSLMAMLGSLCSYWTGPAADALTALAKSVPSPEADMTGSSWCVLTLPGSVVALLVTYCYLSWAHLLPYEPEDTNTEHSAALQSAFTKLKSLGTPSLAGALAVHGSVLVLVMSVPAGYIGKDIRLSLICLLTTAALLLSASCSLFASTCSMVRHAWSGVPWGIVFVLGGVQAASKLVEDCDLLPQLFSLFKPSFWTARSHIEVQAILATISSVLAETTNNRTLSLLMMPIVQDIAESKNMYPMYYAIPVVVGASSNVIMPISIPMVLMHEIGRVPFGRLVALGVVVKIVLVGVVLLTVNAVGRTLYDWGNHHVVPEA